MSFNNKQTKQPIDKVNMALDDIIKRDKRPGPGNQKGGKKPFGMLNKSRAIQKNRRPNNNNRQLNRNGSQGGPRRGGPRPQQAQQQQQRRPRPQGGRLANFNLNKRLNNNQNNNRGRRGPQQQQQPRFGGAQIKNRLSIGNGANRNRLQARPQPPRPRQNNAALKSRLGGGVARGGVARKPLQQPIRKTNLGNKIAMQTARKNVLKAKKLLAQKKKILKQTTQRVVANPVKNGQGPKRVNKMVRVNVRNNTVRPRGNPQVAAKRFKPILKRNRGPAAASGRTVLL